uniref:Bm8383 n=2 Tax=Brugia malayi TaxID=6279 RepID=A0A0J9Y8G3_BRUMA|nr:Bm8383 [Brugia malayi]
MWYGRLQEGVPQLQQRLALDAVWVVPGDIRKQYLKHELRADRLEAEVYLKWSANIGIKNRVKIVLENGYSCNAPACLLTAFSNIFRKHISAQATQETLSSGKEITVHLNGMPNITNAGLYNVVAFIQSGQIKFLESELENVLIAANDLQDGLTSPQNHNQPLSSSIYTVSGAENAVTPTPLRGTLGLAPSPLGSYIIPPFDSVSSATTRSISNETSVSVNKNWRPAQQLPIGSGEMIPLQSSTAPSILPPNILPPKSSRDSICTVITAHNDPVLIYSNVPIATAAASDGTAGAIGGGAIGGGAIGGGATGGGRGEQEGSGAIKSSPTLESAEIRTSSSQESESSSKRRPKFEQIPLRTEPPESRKELRKKRQAREKTDTK